jgi:hypothetical protein
MFDHAFSDPPATLERQRHERIGNDDA